MLRTTVLQDGVWPRAARLLAVALLFGGLGAGPLVHLAAEAVADVPCDVASEHGHPEQVPDAHHDCPVCITLATATPAIFPAVPSARLADESAAPAPARVMDDGPVTDLSRARAPPAA